MNHTVRRTAGMGASSACILRRALAILAVGVVAATAACIRPPGPASEDSREVSGRQAEILESDLPPREREAVVLLVTLHTAQMTWIADQGAPLAYPELLENAIPGRTFEEQCRKIGYRMIVEPSSTEPRYRAVALPLDGSAKSFFCNESGVVRVSPAGAAPASEASPVLVRRRSGPATDSR